MTTSTTTHCPLCGGDLLDSGDYAECDTCYFHTDTGYHRDEVDDRPSPCTDHYTLPTYGCALCKPSARASRVMGDLDHRGSSQYLKGTEGYVGAPVDGWPNDPDSASRGFQSLDTAPPPAPAEWLGESKRLQGRRFVLAPVGKPGWHDSYIYNSWRVRDDTGTQMTWEIPTEVLDSFGMPEHEEG